MKQGRDIIINFISSKTILLFKKVNDEVGENLSEVLKKDILAIRLRNYD